VTTSGHSVGDIPRFGSYVAHPAIVTVNIYILMNTYRWDWLILLLVALSSLAVFAVTGIYTSLSVSEQFLNGATQVYAQPSFWISFFMTPIICLMPRFAIKAIQKVYFPYDVDIIREKEARGDYSTLDKDGRDRSHLRTGSRASNASADGGALPQQQQQHPMIKHGQNASVDEDSRPIYPPSFLTSNTASRNVRSQTGNGSDSTTFTTGPRDTSLDFGAGAGDSHLHVPGLGLGLPPADAAHQTLAEAPEIDIQAPVDEDDGGRQMALAAAAARLSSGQHQQGLSRMDSAAGRARPSMDRTRLSMDRGRPSIDRARPSYDRMRCSMEPVRNSFEASSDFTSAARLSRIESSQCPAPPVSTSLQRLRLRGLSLSKSANQ
jgi:phospholipid-translocating ATPase